MDPRAQYELNKQLADTTKRAMMEAVELVSELRITVSGLEERLSKLDERLDNLETANAGVTHDRTDG